MLFQFEFVFAYIFLIFRSMKNVETERYGSECICNMKLVHITYLSKDYVMALSGDSKKIFKQIPK